jgi:hypothetical protein
MEGGMNARRLGLLATLVTMGGAGWYVFVYLYRWEWNRALISGVIFLAAEIGLIGTLALGRLARIERRLDEGDVPASSPFRSSGVPSRSSRSPVLSRSSVSSRALRRVDADPAVLARLRESAPPPREPFAWLTKRPQELSVFVPVLLGAGAVLSGLAWVVERLGRRLTGPTQEHSLARRLHAIALPPGGFVGDHDDRPDLFSPLP